MDPILDSLPTDKHLALRSYECMCVESVYCFLLASSSKCQVQAMVVFKSTERPSTPGVLLAGKTFSALAVCCDRPPHVELVVGLLRR